MFSFPLPISRPCTRCWRPLTHCACEAVHLFARDDAALARLEGMRQAAACGQWRGEADRGNGAQMRWAFLCWLVAHGKIAAG